MNTRRIGERYELQVPLGASGHVFLAHDPKVNREVVVRLLPIEAAIDGVRKAKFEQLSRAHAGIRHANVVEIYDYGNTPQGEPYLVMEYVRAPSLAQIKNEHSSLSEAVLAAIGFEVCAAIEQAHAHDFTHGQITAENIFLDRGRVVLANFGVDPGTRPPGDPASDVFAFGELIYRLATGHGAFGSTGSDKGQVDEKTIPITFYRPDISSEFRRAIHDCLEKDPRHRTQSVTELRQHLRNVLTRLAVSDPRELLADFSAGKTRLTGNFPPPSRFPDWLARSGMLLVIIALSAAVVYLERERRARLEEDKASDKGARTLVDISAPTPVEIYLDDNLIGETPLSVSLPSGIKTLEFATDHQRFAKKVTLPGGSHLALEVDVGGEDVRTKEVPAKKAPRKRR